MDMRAMIEEEDVYAYSQSNQISAQTGLIGFLRADMDTNGNGFFSNWFGVRDDLKTQEFKDDLDDVINELREEGDILHNRAALAKYCREHPQAKIVDDNYGVRVDTEKYTYMIRLDPNKGVYNVYCYCYKKDWLNDHIKQARRGIKFVTPQYEEKFRIKDGGKIKMHMKDGTQRIEQCRYIDDYHVEVGSNIYHICELAENLEKNGIEVEAV